ncbi:MAG: hypothetical protein IK109_10565 [Clostridiales bacterium]|nr:hypothetical protein [Clostridiales bacterium]
MGNKLVRIIVPIVAVVVSLVAIGIAAYFVVTQITDSSKNLEEEKLRIETEYQELGENNADPATGKTILTEKYLAKDYQKFYATKKSSNTLLRNIVLIFVIIAVGLCVISTVSDSIVAISKGRGLQLRGIISAIIVIPIVLACMFLVKQMIARKMPAEPGQETITVYQIKVLDTKTETKTKRDSDGDETTTTYYYLILDDNGTRRQRQVNYSLYSEASEPGIYFLAQASGNNNVFDFMIYSANDYMKEK